MLYKDDVLLDLRGAESLRLEDRLLSEGGRDNADLAYGSEATSARTREEVTRGCGLGSSPWYVRMGSR